jgi:hypothetical protein
MEVEWALRMCSDRSSGVVLFSFSMFSHCRYPYVISYIMILHSAFAGTNIAIQSDTRPRLGVCIYMYVCE